MLPSLLGIFRKNEARLITASNLFNAEWYCANYPEVKSSGMGAAEHYLKLGASLKYNPSCEFDTAWYLLTYPDVAADGMNPLLHYLLHGQYEGRLSCENKALAFDHLLWSGDEESTLPALDSLIHDQLASAQERSFAAWSLARWYAWKCDWPRVAELMRLFCKSPIRIPHHHGPSLLEVDALTKIGAFDKAEYRLKKLLKANPDYPDFCLAFANLLAGCLKLKSTVPDHRLKWINRPFQSNSLMPLCLQDATRPLTLDNIHACGSESKSAVAPSSDPPLISIIVPAFNAEKTLSTALTSLAQQTWENLEIIIVDDCSEDKTLSVVQKFANHDARFKVFRHERNQGSYVTRNTGLSVAKGDFLTIHDSDDWSHPQKIEMQVKVLQDCPELAASMSHLVRTTTSLEFGRWRMEEGWIYRNTSSLMFSRRVFEKLGFWDRVKVSADTEYFYRILRAFGKTSVKEVLPGIPLAFCRHLPNSLSQNSLTHLRTQFQGVRKDYHDAVLKWHARANDFSDLYLPADPEHRPFPAPAAICLDSTSGTRNLSSQQKSVSSSSNHKNIFCEPDQGSSREENPGRKPPQLEHEVIKRSNGENGRSDFELIQSTAFFDDAWYLKNNPDVALAEINPVRHYLLHGSPEGRDPGPGFSTSGYFHANVDVGQTAMNPLVHFLESGQLMGRPPLPFFQGGVPFKKNLKNILVCGHQAETQLYGAELSLIDLVKGLEEIGFNVFVSLPKCINTSYLETLRALSAGVWVRPYAWWHADRSTCYQVQKSFEGFLSEFKIDFLYANTLTLYEPLLAARALGLKTLVHVREMPENDPALCESLGGSPAQIREHVLDLADVLVANSEVASRYLDTPGTIVVPNTVDMESFDLDNEVDPDCIKVGLISSNLPKKGIYDFVEVARVLAVEAPRVQCLMIGPENQFISELKAKQAVGEIPGNLLFPGYAATPQQAISQANILVNLSHFEESFGRTVLEAMAARRPVVCYDWGALPELVVHGETGYLVTFRHTEAVARCVKSLCDNPEQLQKMGESGRLRARKLFSRRAFLGKLDKVRAMLAE